jgi:hypothetical protein
MRVVPTFQDTPLLAKGHAQTQSRGIHGARRSPITINTVNAGPGAVAHAGDVIAEPDMSSVPSWIRGPWAALLGLATLASTYAAFAAGLGWPPL